MPRKQPEPTVPVTLYARAMYALDRVTMLCYIPDEGKLYLASVPERVP